MATCNNRGCRQRRWFQFNFLLRLRVRRSQPTDLFYWINSYLVQPNKIDGSANYEKFKKTGKVKKAFSGRGVIAKYPRQCLGEKINQKQRLPGLTRLPGQCLKHTFKTNLT